MNLPLKPVGGVGGEAGGVCVGAQGAPSATFSAEDAMAESIVRIQRELEECQAQCALYEAERVIMQRTIEGLRDHLCADKCRDKAAADGGWANI